MKRLGLLFLLLATLGIVVFVGVVWLTRPIPQSPLSRLPRAFHDSTVVVAHEEPRLFGSDNGCRWILYRLSERWTKALRTQGLAALRAAGTDALAGPEPEPSTRGRVYRYPAWRPSPATPPAVRAELERNSASGEPCWANSLFWCRRKPADRDAEMLEALRARAELPGSFIAAEPTDCRVLLIVPDHHDGSAYAVLIEHA